MSPFASPIPAPPTPQSSKSALRAHLRKHILPSLPEEQISSQSHRAQQVILQHLPAWQKADRVSLYLSMPSGEARTEGLVRRALGEGKGVFVPVLCREQEEKVGGEECGKREAMEDGDAGGGGGPLLGGGGGDDGGGGSAAVGDSGTGEPKPKKKKRKMRMEMLRLNSLEEFELLERDSWGIPSLPPTSLAGRENARGGFGPEGRPSRPGNEEEERYEGKGKGENGNEVMEENGGGLDLIVVPGVAFDREMARMGHGAGFYDGYLTRLVTEGRHKKPFLVGLCLAEQVLEPGRILMEDWDWRVDAVATGDGRLLTADGGV
ncbi:hypothetical protein KC318_g13681 [Hortaea werneckii]|uniref:5-formyltetrahydrofolate cyclo-ligase n=1 Tax=Hortaea werneckii TaxID=91943 RepID=A0A3M7BFV3_HORWE|nr:hypothetical protein KC334_g14762 [Hortaea werneckii]KAI6953112.1 hypothetical protein KC355_g13831 [Hortaea werneckii]KAI7654299.1 hypothetical protein KC318_g13681 [Hortaea werneckii]RMY22686.1 hypothetical protein D0867_02557 [Hortaea werneckii]RMY38437.1 hypothetical protein D0866_02597 [Hortaea werneckii]